MINDTIKNSEINMQKAIESFKGELSKLRTGRAHPGLVENVKVDHYGNETPLKNVASIQISDARTISITPWDKTMLKAIEKAIFNADLGVNPVCDANLVRIPIPPLNEERRKELVKVVKNVAEHSRVSVRNIRRDAMAHLKALLKDKKITEDDDRRAQDSVQKMTDKFVAEIDKLAIAKEGELMTI